MTDYISHGQNSHAVRLTVYLIRLRHKKGLLMVKSVLPQTLDLAHLLIYKFSQAGFESQRVSSFEFTFHLLIFIFWTKNMRINHRHPQASWLPAARLCISNLSIVVGAVMKSLSSNESHTHSRETGAFGSIKWLLELPFNKCVSVCSSSFQSITQSLVTGMGL